MQKDIKMIIEEFLNKTEFKEPYSFRILAIMKRDEKLKNELYKYFIKVVLRV